MLDIFSSLPFYTENVYLPWLGDAIPEIHEHFRFFPFFQNAIGAMDGTHFYCTPTVVEHQVAVDLKGCVTQKKIHVCDETHIYPILQQVLTVREIGRASCRERVCMLV